ncbi:hypothetical protein [Saccharomonospora piscinae]|nr:hypothetical protein [Saccharomonospora piscinae]
MFVIVQPSGGDGAEVVEPTPGVRQLIVGVGNAALSVQVPGRIGGPADAARFARGLSSAALDFAEWCEQQSFGRHRLGDSPRGGDPSASWPTEGGS